MNIRFCHAVFVLISFACVHCAAAQGTEMADANDNGSSKEAIMQHRLLNALLDMGRSADCYFTVELVQPKDPSHSLKEKMIRCADLPKTVDGAIKLLRGQLPGVTVRRSKANPVVVHVIENAAKNMPGYWLDQKVSLSFSGMLGGVFKPLQKALGPKLEFVHVALLGAVVSGMLDYETRIAIKQEDAAVRDCLTDSMPLSSSPEPPRPLA